MPLTLGIDCAVRWTNIGLAQSGETIGEMNLNIGRKQAARLPLVVGTLLEQCAARLADVERIAVTNGPGYYTGIRVGLSYAVALAKGIGVPVAPVSTLRALAFSCPRADGIVAAAIKAKTGCVYGAVFDRENEAALLRPKFFFVEDFLRALDAWGDVEIVTQTPEFFSRGRIVRVDGAMGGIVAQLGANAAAALFAPEKIRAEYLRDPD